MGGNKTLKHYVKPELYVERFELAQHIAGCYVQMNLTSAATCEAKAGSFGGSDVTGWFTNAVTNCSSKMPGFEGYCYTNSVNVMGMFQS